jgi:hypothetical protein
MSDKPSHRFWKIHLATAIVLMLVVCGVLFLCMSTRTMESADRGDGIITRYGWPMKAVWRYTNSVQPITSWPEYVRSNPYGMDILGLLIDGCVALSFFVTAIVVCEAVVRGKTGQLQIHLATAIVLMFAAGGLLWANLRPHTDNPGYSLVIFSGPGWPQPTFQTFVDAGDSGAVMPNAWWNGDWGGFASAAAINVLVALPILGFVAIICESIIRRRERGRA